MSTASSAVSEKSVTGAEAEVEPQSPGIQGGIREQADESPIAVKESAPKESKPKQNDFSKEPIFEIAGKVDMAN